MDIQEIVRLYVDGRAGIVSLARQFHVKQAKIKRILLDNGVTLRSLTELRLSKSINTQEVVSLYQNNHSIKTIAICLKINPKTVRRRLVLANVTLRSLSDACKSRPNKPRGRYIEPTEAFWQKVNKRGPVPKHQRSLGRCWVWTGSKGRRGLGHFSYQDDNGKRINLTSPRFSYQQQYGPFPKGKPFACHKCDNPSCVRPSHLFAGSHQDNMNDAVAKDRFHSGTSNHNAKLSVSRVRRIRKLYNTENLSQVELANRFGVAQPTISSVILNKTWRRF